MRGVSEPRRPWHTGGTPTGAGEPPSFEMETHD